MLFFALAAGAVARASLGVRNVTGLQGAAGQPTPPFPPSWRMNDSTLLYWRNGTGYEPTEVLGKYGMLIFDWAHGAKLWINNYSPMDNGAVLAEQCRQLKLSYPNAKRLVYRNTVKVSKSPSRFN